MTAFTSKLTAGLSVLGHLLTCKVLKSVALRTLCPETSVLGLAELSRYWEVVWFSRPWTENPETLSVPTSATELLGDLRQVTPFP